ncbi:MAG TPA: hypothetical protein VH207_04000 [Chthoniobacterales bacterium]|nr:hypothetical protein [Chthoniobacterales bacterium]
MTAISATDAWAVGDVYSPEKGDQQTLTQHWEGRRWRTVRSPSLPRHYNHLVSVSGANSNDVWAVGYTIDDRTSAWQALILHWDGSRWSIVQGAALATQYNALTRVLALAWNDVWIVGYNGTSINFHTLAEHWDGFSWSKVATPAPGTYDALNGLAGTGSNDLWVTGYYKIGVTTYKSLTLHWDGNAWVEIESPNTTEYNWFNGVTATAADSAWAVGYEIEDDGTATSHPLIQRWNATEWSVVAGPAAPNGHYTNLSDAAWNSSTDIVAVGTSSDAHDNFDPLIEQFDGVQWSSAIVPEMAGFPTTFIFSVAPDETGGYWAVGWAQKPSPLTFKNYIVRRSP